MSWNAEIVTEPSRSHELCVDLFDGDVHRARIRRNELGEVELVVYGGEFTVPADWLIDVIQRFSAETDLKRPEDGA